MSYKSRIKVFIIFQAVFYSSENKMKKSNYLNFIIFLTLIVGGLAYFSRDIYHAVKYPDYQKHVFDEDGNAYETIIVGNQIWIAQNMNKQTVHGSSCYDNKPENCEKYGHLYDWATALNLPSWCNKNNCSSRIAYPHQGLCPEGFHIPTESEFNELSEFIKDKDVSNYGFSAVFAGLGYTTSKYKYLNERALFWTVLEDSVSFAKAQTYLKPAGWPNMTKVEKSIRTSLRCIQNRNAEKTTKKIEAMPSVYWNGFPVVNDADSLQTVRIGEQEWMRRNLNVETTNGSWCYDNKPENCEKYGRLYTWSAAMALPALCSRKECAGRIKYPHQGLCPSGFHIPTKEELDILFSYAGGEKKASVELKTRIGWSGGANGFDSFGFSALPSGFVGFRNGDFIGAGTETSFLSSTEKDSTFAFLLLIIGDYIDNDLWGAKEGGSSIRCLKD